MRNVTVIVFTLLLAIGAANAQERMISSNSSNFPAPNPEFTRQRQLLAGTWKVWVDAKCVNPQAHAPTFQSRVYRAQKGGLPELVMETMYFGRQLEPLLSRSGQVLVHANNQFVLYPVDGGPIDITSQIDGNPWTTQQLLEHATTITSEQWHQQFEIGPGSIQATFVHMIGATLRWSDQIAGRSERSLDILAQLRE